MQRLDDSVSISLLNIYKKIEVKELKKAEQRCCCMPDVLPPKLEINVIAVVSKCDGLVKVLWHLIRVAKGAFGQKGVNTIEFKELFLKIPIRVFC